MPSVARGQLKRVKNLIPKPGANPTYLATVLRTAEGESVAALFTDAQIETAVSRAKKNAEDCRTPLTWLRSVINVVVNP